MSGRRGQLSGEAGEELLRAGRAFASAAAPHAQEHTEEEEQDEESCEAKRPRRVSLSPQAMAREGGGGGGGCSSGLGGVMGGRPARQVHVPCPEAPPPSSHAGVEHRVWGPA